MFTSFFPTRGNAVEPWQVVNFSNLSNIDQLESRSFSFTIRISDSKVLEKLEIKGYSVKGGASLTPKDKINYFGKTPESFLSYQCFGVKPIYFGNENAFSLLEGVTTLGKNFRDITFNCWFPIGMRQGSYALTINVALWFNQGWSSSDSWANQQVFVFGATDSPISIFQSKMAAQSNFSDKNSVVTGLKIGDIEVRRRDGYFEDGIQILNSKRIDSIASTLAQDYKSINSRINKLRVSYSVLANETQALSTRVRNLGNSPITKNFASEYDAIKKSLQEVLSDQANVNSLIFNKGTNTKDKDIYWNYIQSLNFDTGNAPQIFAIDYPDLLNLKGAKTPYIKMIIKSKNQIYRISSFIAKSNGGIPLHFTGNVLIPGEEPINRQTGGGLVLLQDQFRQDGNIFSTLLVSPMSTPVSNETLESLKQADSTCVDILDVAGNASLTWNCTPQKWGGIPNSNISDQAGDEFQELVLKYQKLYESNKNLQQISDPDKNSEGQLSILNEKVNEVAISVTSLERKISNKSRVILISCVKGKIVKKIPASSLICPPGYKKV